MVSHPNTGPSGSNSFHSSLTLDPNTCLEKMPDRACPQEFAAVLKQAEVEGGKKLKNNLLIPTIVKTRGILDSLPLTHTNHQVKIWIISGSYLLAI